MTEEPGRAGAGSPPGLPAGTQLHEAAFAELDAATAYRLLRLRVDVFVVEQACPYPELDGRDLEPGTRHLWVDDEHGRVLAYLRVLRERDGTARIGRVATAASARRQGLAARLLSQALEGVADRRVILDAQAHLQGWYAAFGFAPLGPPFVEDGIPHVPMGREPVR